MARDAVQVASRRTSIEAMSAEPASSAWKPRSIVRRTSLKAVGQPVRAAPISGTSLPIVIHVVTARAPAAATSG